MDEAHIVDELQSQLTLVADCVTNALIALDRAEAVISVLGVPAMLELDGVISSFEALESQVMGLLDDVEASTRSNEEKT